MRAVPCLPEEDEERGQEDGTLVDCAPQRARLHLETLRQSTCTRAQHVMMLE